MARSLLVALALAASLTALAAPAVLADQPTPAPSTTPGPAQRCQQLTADDPVGIVARLSCDAVRSGPGGAVSDAANGTAAVAQQAGQAAVQGVETNFDSWLADGAAWMTQAVLAKVTGPSTTPALDPAHAAAFARVYGRVVGVALSLSVLLVLLGVIEAVLSQRPGGLRRVIVGIAVSGIGMGAVPVATGILLSVVDDLSQYVVSGQGQTIADGLQTTIHLLRNFDATQTGGAAFAWSAFGVLVGGTVLWLELVTRESLVYLFLAVVPLACAAVQWPRLEGVLRQVLFAGLALILSKLVIAIALAVGFAVMGTATGLEALLAGMFVLLLAALAPFTLARVLPLAAEELGHATQGRARAAAVGGLQTTSRLGMSIATGAVDQLDPRRSTLPIAPAMGRSVPAWGAAYRGGAPSAGRGNSSGRGASAATNVAAGSGSTPGRTGLGPTPPAASSPPTPGPPPPPGSKPPRTGGPPTAA
jgi:hypothetical protein